MAPFLVGVVIFLFNSVSERGLEPAKNSVKYDSSLISFWRGLFRVKSKPFSAPWQVNSFLISANYLIYAVTVFQFFPILLLQFTFFDFFESFSNAGYSFFRFCKSILWKG